jgi:hypothetical protein
VSRKEEILELIAGVLMHNNEVDVKQALALSRNDDVWLDVLKRGLELIDKVGPDTWSVTARGKEYFEKGGDL